MKRATFRSAFLSDGTMDGNEYRAPTESMRTRTSTPRRFAAARASRNRRPARSLSKMYVDRLMVLLASSMAASMAG